jgi:hypothetical protein
MHTIIQVWRVVIELFFMPSVVGHRNGVTLRALFDKGPTALLRRVDGLRADIEPSFHSC